MRQEQRRARGEGASPPGLSRAWRARLTYFARGAHDSRQRRLGSTRELPAAERAPATHNFLKEQNAGCPRVLNSTFWAATPPLNRSRFLSHPNETAVASEGARGRPRRSRSRDLPEERSR